jgi:hypothetical protein
VFHHHKTANIITAVFALLIIGQTSAFLISSASSNSASAAVSATAIEDNNPLSKLQIKIPGLDKMMEEHKVTCSSDNTRCSIPWISLYIAAWYKYLIGGIGILATVMMMYAGVLWITAAGSSEQIGKAKGFIGSSLTGLILAISSYMILYQINPDLINLKPIEVAIPGKKAEPIVLTSQKDADIRTTLQNENIFINKSNCATESQTDCTSLDGLPPMAINGVINIKQALGYNGRLMITGGTEAGHMEHGQGKPVVDLRVCPAGKCLNIDKNVELISYMHKQAGLGFGDGFEYNKKYTSTDGNFETMLEKNADGSEHFHVRFLKLTELEE